MQFYQFACKLTRDEMAEKTYARSDTVRRTAVLLISVLSLKYVVVSDAASVGPHDHGGDGAAASPSAARSTYHRGSRSVAALKDRLEKIDLNEKLSSDPHSEQPGSRLRDVVDQQQSVANCADCSGDGKLQAKRSSLIESVRSYVLHRLRQDYPSRNVTLTGLPSDWGLGEKSNQEEANADALDLLLLSFPVNESTDTCQFEFQQTVRNQNIVRASIYIYVLRHQNASDSRDTKRTRIHLHQIRGEERVRIESRPIRTHGDSGWLHFDVTPKVYSWLHGQSSNNFQLLVEAYDSDGTSLAVVNPSDPSDDPFKPYMKIYSNARFHTRSKRATTDQVCNEAGTERSCRRLPMTVDFTSFGWDWVIIPKRFQAFHCAGVCSHNHGTEITDRHGVQQQQQQQQASRVSTPCCSPKRTSPITVLFYNDDAAVEKVEVPDMVVEECGCV